MKITRTAGRSAAAALLLLVLTAVVASRPQRRHRPKWGVGDDGASNGELIIADTAERELRVETADGVREQFSDERRIRTCVLRRDSALPTEDTGTGIERTTPSPNPAIWLPLYIANPALYSGGNTGAASGSSFNGGGGFTGGGASGSY